ncbi:hypothetical protein DMC64_20045 [Amycolatopsis sp. WAC 04197]|nr:hypothetical protein DMC64_20045 [Amycolatopsis sp. WAC 04197]
MSAVIDGPEVVLDVPVRAVNASTALAEAQAKVTDLMMVLATTFCGYEFVVDNRQSTRRTDAVYQPDGPPPPFDVAEGGISEAGASWLDPDGTARRAGRVLTFRANGFVTHPPAQDVRRFAGRESWPPQLRSGLRLFHAAQNSRDEIVEFTLTAAALEVLANIDETLAIATLPDREQDRLRRALTALLDDFNFTTAERTRLHSRLLDTRARGSAQAIRDYLNKHEVTIAPGDLRWWQRKRGGYLHDGSFDDDPPRRYRLRHAVGKCLAAELDTFVTDLPVPQATEHNPDDCR